MPVSEATLKMARRLGREDAKDAIILAREAPSELDKMTFDLGDVMGVDYASDRAGKPAQRLVSEWDQVHEQLAHGRIWGIERNPLLTRLPGGAETWQTAWAEIEDDGEMDEEPQKALNAYTDAFSEELEAADVVVLETFAYPSADPRFQDIDGEPIFSLYAVDRRRFPEFHEEFSLGREFDGEWILGEENVQKIYSEPKRSLWKRLTRSR